MRASNRPGVFVYLNNRSRSKERRSLVTTLGDIETRRSGRHVEKLCACVSLSLLSSLSLSSVGSLPASFFLSTAFCLCLPPRVRGHYCCTCDAIPSRRRPHREKRKPAVLRRRRKRLDLGPRRAAAAAAVGVVLWCPRWHLHSPATDGKCVREIAFYILTTYVRVSEWPAVST